GSYVRVPSLEFPTIYLIDANGMIEGHYEYGALTHGIFEANGLLPELDKLVGAAPAMSMAPVKKK
ncbi:MAG TPA: hypothetical protein VNY05_01985, partial [Candidatus Acidoferrales bacterium]|nr:hypothetical protein [Candidatus Acidoferrales bacterium]